MTLGWLSPRRSLGRSRANLVLVGRSQIPERDDWTAWLAGHGHRDPMSRRLSRMQELERLGARVLTGQCGRFRHRAASGSHRSGARRIRPTARRHPCCGSHRGRRLRSDRGHDGRCLRAAFQAEGRRSACARRRSGRRASRFLRTCLLALRAPRRPWLCRLRRLPMRTWMSFAAARAREGKHWMSINWDGWDFSANRAKDGSR